MHVVGFRYLELPRNLVNADLLSLSRCQQVFIFFSNVYYNYVSHYVVFFVKLK